VNAQTMPEVYACRNFPGFNQRDFENPTWPGTDYILSSYNNNNLVIKQFLNNFSYEVFITTCKCV